MNAILLMLLRLGLKAVIFSVSKLDASQWAKIGDLIIQFLMRIEDHLPPGNPLTVVLSGYKAAPSKLQPSIKDEV